MMKHTGTYLGYKDENGNEMHCAHAFCPHAEKCLKGCADRVAKPALRPCPFCGSTPAVIEIEPHSHAGGIADFMPNHPGSAYIDCACGVGMIDEDSETVTNRWNKRVDGEAMRDVNEMLRQLCTSGVLDPLQLEGADEIVRLQRALKERNDTISMVMVESIGKLDPKASDDAPVNVSFRTLLRWYDQLEACLSITSSDRDR